jgi:hypothetical protein
VENYIHVIRGDLEDVVAASLGEEVVAIAAMCDRYRVDETVLFEGAEEWITGGASARVATNITRQPGQVRKPLPTPLSAHSNTFSQRQPRLSDSSAHSTVFRPPPAPVSPKNHGSIARSDIRCRLSARGKRPPLPAIPRQVKDPTDEP